MTKQRKKPKSQGRLFLSCLSESTSCKLTVQKPENVVSVRVCSYPEEFLSGNGCSVNMIPPCIIKYLGTLIRKLDNIPRAGGAKLCGREGNKIIDSSYIV